MEAINVVRSGRYGDDHRRLKINRRRVDRSGVNRGRDRACRRYNHRSRADRGGLRNEERSWDCDIQSYMMVGNRQIRARQPKEEPKVVARLRSEREGRH